MEIHKIPDGKGSEYLSMFSKEIEYVKPSEHFYQSKLAICTASLMHITSHKRNIIPADLVKAEARKQTDELWQEFLREAEKTGAHDVLMAALLAESKKDQVKLLQDLKITVPQLMAFLLKAEGEGFLFSEYKADHHPKDIKEGDLPTVVHKAEDGIHKVGETKLSDGKLAQVLEHRKVTVAKFLDNGERWACLFTTFDAIGGKEPWKGGQAHFHFISDKFGVTRERVVAELQKAQYSLSSLPHIALIDYGKQQDGSFM